MRIPFISLAAAGALALGGCTYGGLGLGYGSDPYYGGGYGYGYGSPYGSYYGSPYYNSGYYGGLGYGYSPFGWYNNYYYPGTGYYVYDQYRRPRTMTISERQYWLMRARAASARNGTTSTTTTATVPSRTARQPENWSGFRSRAATRSSATTVSEDTSTSSSPRQHRRRN